MKRIVRIFLILVLTISSCLPVSANMNYEGVFYVPEVRIKNKDIIAFMRERVIKIAEDVFPNWVNMPFVGYSITFEKNPCGTYYVVVAACGQETDLRDIRYKESIESGDAYDSFVSYIDGREILIHAKPDCPYIEIGKKKIRINQDQLDFFFGSIIWILTLSGDRLTDAHLDWENRVDITTDKRFRNKDSYLLPKICIEPFWRPKAVLDNPFDTILPPQFIIIPKPTSSDKEIEI